MTRIFISRDSASLSVGAARIARLVREEAAVRGVDLEIVLTGSRGLFWLEPMAEVETPEGRIAYGPISPSAIGSLFNAGFLTGAGHPLRMGRLEDHPYLARQQRLTFGRCGIVDPLSVDDYMAHGGYAGLKRALGLEPQAIVDEVKLSGLRGRGRVPDRDQVGHGPSRAG
jgi:formate dehydrogenase iron-sulfur subunit